MSNSGYRDDLNFIKSTEKKVADLSQLELQLLADPRAKEANSVHSLALIGLPLRRKEYEKYLNQRTFEDRRSEEATNNMSKDTLEKKIQYLNQMETLLLADKSGKESDTLASLALYGLTSRREGYQERINTMTFAVIQHSSVDS